MVEFVSGIAGLRMADPDSVGEDGADEEQNAVGGPDEDG